MLDNVTTALSRLTEHFDSASWTVSTSATVVALTRIPKCIALLWSIIFVTPSCNVHLIITLLSHSNTFKVYLAKLFLLGGPNTLFISLVPRPHPAQGRRRSLVSQVQILGLAPEAWSGQSNRRAAFIGIMRKREQVLQSYHSKRVMTFIIQHL